MRSYTLVFFLCAVSYFSFGQKSLSFSLGSTARSLQQASNRRDVLLDYTSVGAQFSYFTSPKAELFSGVSYGFQSSGTAKFAGAQAGMRYFLNLPLPARLRVFGQFAGEILLDNSYAITNRDTDFIGAVGVGFDFKVSSAVSLRGSTNLGLPFLSTGSLSPYTNSGSNFTAGIGLVFLLPSKKEAVVAPLISVAEEPIVAAVTSPEPVKATVPAPVVKEEVPVVAVAPVAEPAAVVVPAPVVVAEVNLDSLFNKEIYFKTDKSWVGPESTKKLDLIVALMTKFPDVKVHLKGHTDYRKSEDYNLKLSAKRVENVRLYLVKQGVAASRFKTEAFSEEVPASKTDLQLNRRVEVRIWR